MKVADTIYTVICDDVREEVGNKLSLIGLYRREIKFKAIPVVIPKIAFVVFLEDLKKVIPDLLVKAYFPGREPHEIKLKKPHKTKKTDAVLSFFLSPVRIEEVGEMVFELYFGKEKSPTHTQRLKIIDISEKEPEK